MFLGELCAKNEENRLCKSKVRLKLLFYSYGISEQRVLIIASPSQKSPKLQ